MSNDIFTLHPGDRPLVLSMPHVGTVIPDALQLRYHPRALSVEDTDWHLERLYAFARGLGASVLVPRYSRYVVDLNRPPENVPMYPGANNTELVPTRFFTGDPLYLDGQAPTEAEVADRVQTYWRPYHQALRHEVDRLRTLHGHVVLFDCHSIKGELPWLFDGRLWDLNLGTASGQSCAPALCEALQTVLASQQRYTHITDGRFKGGHITRHYGQPGHGVHAVQLEMSWRAYMQEQAPYVWDETLAMQVQPLLRQLVQAMLDFQP